MKKFSMVALAVILLLTACAPNFQKQEEVVEQKNDDTKEKAIIPKYKISDNYYRTIMPFQPGEGRGLVVNNLSTRYDINEFETGLMRLAQNDFDPDRFVFKEGQYLERNTVRLWLNRQFTEAQLKDEKLKPNQNIGLNPLDPGTGDIKERNEKYPIYLAHILEHNYLVRNDEKGTYQLGGIVIGLAMNSVYYYQTQQYGATFEKKIDHAVLEKEGKRIAAEVISRMRKMDGLKDVPISIALFEQAERTSVVPGNFFAYAAAPKGSTDLEWANVDEKYVLFPSAEAQKDHRDDWTFFSNFKQDVEEYFPNFNGVIGKAFYVGDQLQELSIEIPIQFYGKAEGIGFTQYVTGLVMEHFPNYISVQVSVTSVNGPEALIVRKPEQDEPFVHIYQ